MTRGELGRQELSAPRAAAAALASGVVFAFAAPPTDAPLAILAGLAGFAFILPGASGPARARRAVLVGWMFGIGANLVALRFVPEVITRFTSLGTAPALLALLLLALGQAVPWLVGALAAHVLHRRGIARWLSFACGVYIATFLPAVFPWTPAGGLAPWPWLLQLADVIGERGVSLLIAAAAGLVADALMAVRSRSGRARRGSLAPLAASVALLALLTVHGAVRSRSIEAARNQAPHARVALVQPLFEAFDRWEAERSEMMMARLTALTLTAERRGAELVVWPESAYPYPIPHALRRSPRGARAFLGHGVRGPVLTGAYTTAGRGQSYNAAILARTDGTLSEPYAKRHLLWFGETVPLADTFPWVRRVFARGTGILPGERQVLFEAGAVRAAVLNCYEDTLPVAGREAMEVSPNLLVNVTNDAWFAGSAEGELHLRLSVLRAIELRRDMVRAVNAGPTSWVDATGRVRLRYTGPVPAAPLTTPALLTGETFYARHGEAPFALLVSLSAIAGALGARRKQERARG